MTDAISERILGLCGYLRLGFEVRHAGLMRTELRDLLREIDAPMPAFRAVIALGDPDLIALLLTRFGPDIFDRSEDVMGEHRDPLREVSFSDIPAAHRIPAFDLLEPHSRVSPASLGPRLLRRAVQSGDRDFIDRLMQYCPGVSLTQIALSPPALADMTPEGWDIVTGILQDLPADAPQVAAFAEEVIRRQIEVGTALLIATGHPVGPAIAAQRLAGNPWPKRLERRISGAHAALKLRMALPAPQDLARMEAKDLQLLLAGPSPKAVKQAEKEARKQAQLARRDEIRAARAARTQSEE